MKQKLLKLLKSLELDYNHNWPNEDKITKIYRQEKLKEIKENIKNLKKYV